MNFITAEHSHKPWLIKQRWSDVLFYHFMMNPSELQKLVPFPLDLYQNQAFVSIVPFQMSHIEIRHIPRILTSWSRLFEINLRTYVIVDGVPGIYFFTLDATSLFGVLIAKYFFNLPYHYAQCELTNSSVQDLSYKYSRKNYHFQSDFKILGNKIKNKTDIWLTERYSLFTKKNRKAFQGIVKHSPWPLFDVEVINIKDDFSKMIQKKITTADIISPSYCRRLDVSFEPFRRI